MSFTNLALGLVFGTAAASMLFVAWAALVVGHQIAWRWVGNKMGRRNAVLAVRL